MNSLLDTKIITTLLIMTLDEFRMNTLLHLLQFVVTF